MYCIIASILQRELPILMGWGCPGGQGYTHDHYQNDAFTRPLEGVIFLEKVKNVRNVNGPGRSEQLIMWDENRLMKFVCEAWRW